MKDAASGFIMPSLLSKQFGRLQFHREHRCINIVGQIAPQRHWRSSLAYKGCAHLLCEFKQSTYPRIADEIPRNLNSMRKTVLISSSKIKPKSTYITCIHVRALPCCSSSIPLHYRPFLSSSRHIKSVFAPDRDTQAPCALLVKWGSKC